MRVALLGSSSNFRIALCEHGLEFSLDVVVVDLFFVDFAWDVSVFDLWGWAFEGHFRVSDGDEDDPGEK